MLRVVAAAVALVLAVGGGLWWYFRSGTTRPTTAAAITASIADATGALPDTPRAVVVIVEENKSFHDIVDEPEHTPYLAALIKKGALFTHASGLAHPSQPNYFALFAGRITRNGDSCPASGLATTAPNLAAEVLAAHRSFRAYSEDLPSVGFRACWSGQYARKHAPWTHFDNIPAGVGVPLTALRSFDELPDVAFIIPNLLDDMHSASRERGDAWLRAHVDPLLAWAKRRNALIVITFDESSAPVTNHIPTILLGPMVKPGRYDEPVDHYRVLRTIEDLFRIRTHAGHAAEVPPITDVWR
ncbi:MAG: alkaline phosphatase family protein [Candidatus Velthaea sp.]